MPRLRTRTRNRLLLILVLLILLPLGYRLWLEVRARAEIDRLIAQVGDRATVRHDALDVGWDGRVRLREVEILPRDFLQPVRIARIDYDAHLLDRLLDPSRWGESRRGPPERMTLHVEGLRLALEDLLRLRAGGGALDPCEGLGVTPARLQAEGAPELVLSLDARHRFDVPAERLETRVALAFDDLQRVVVEGRFEGLVPEDLAEGRIGRIRLAELRIVQEIDPAYGRRWNAECARRAGLDEAAWQARQLARWRAELERGGIRPGARLAEAFAAYLRDWGEVEVVIRPESPLPLPALLRIRPERAVSELGVSLILGGRPVVPLELTLTRPVGALLPVPGAREEDAGVRRDAAPLAYRIRRVFREVPVDRLADQLGRRVRLHAEGQPARTGRLVAVVDGDAALEQRVPGGRMEVFVPLRSIRRVEVETVLREPRPRRDSPAPQ